MTNCLIGLGGNLGSPADTFVQALTHLHGDDIQVRQVSPLYRSQPVGPQDQPDFINAVIRVDTQLSATQLLQRLQQCEHHFGRIRLRHWGERTLDLDLLLYGDQRLDLPELTVPHPRLHQRAFVLVPLADLIPEHTVPGMNQNIHALSLQCNRDGVCYHGEMNWSPNSDA